MLPCICSLVLVVLVATPAAPEDIGMRAQDAARLVVMLSGGPDKAPIGAGIIVGRKPGQLFVVTANHVVRRGADVEDLGVSFRDKPQQVIGARLLSDFDGKMDLAVLSVSASPASAVDPCAMAFDQLGNNDDLARGSHVFPMGNPNGAPWALPVTPDVVSEIIEDQVLFQSTFISEGHSGGALLNSSGYLVGMICADAPPFGRAVRLDAVLGKMRAWGYPTQLTRPRPFHWIGLLSDERWTRLHEAAESGDTAAITALLRDCEKIDGRSTHGRTALHVAVENGKLDAITALVKAGANVNAQGFGDFDDSPLLIAVERGLMPAADLLLRLGADPDLARHYGTTPLLEAVERNDAAMVLRLIAAHAALGKAHKGGITPLRLAVTKSRPPFRPDLNEPNVKIVHSLLAAGARPGARDVIQVINDYNERASTALDLLLAAKPSLNESSEGNGKGTTPLLTAIYFPDYVKRLVRSGADVNLGSDDGGPYGFVTPLAWATRYDRETFDFLRAHGAQLGPLSKETRDRLFVDAINYGNAVAIELLLARGADAKDPAHGPLVCLAVSKGYLDVVKILLRAGADPNLVENYSVAPPLYIAVREQQVEMVRILLDGGADANVEYSDDSPLDLAEVLQNSEVIRLLRLHGARARHLH
jgi:ankyrin repeat protein